MLGHPYRAKVRPLAPDLYEVISPDFPGAAVRIHASDEAEALRRAGPWLAACVVGRYRDR